MSAKYTKAKKKSRRVKESTTAENLERKFDAGEDVSDYFDLKNARWIEPSSRRVNVDFSSASLEKLDAEAARINVTRQSLIKIWIDERLQDIEFKRAA